MIEKKDYTKYLSVDNGQGLLLYKKDVDILNHYGIDWCRISNFKELILMIGQFIDDSYEDNLEDLEEVLYHVMEMHYYYEVYK